MHTLKKAHSRVLSDQFDIVVDRTVDDALRKVLLCD